MYEKYFIYEYYFLFFNPECNSKNIIMTRVLIKNYINNI